MSASFEVSSSTGAYGVEIVPGSFAALAKATGDVVTVCDERFAKDLGGGRVLALAADESTKSLEAMPAIISRLRELGATRSTRLVAVGGGIVQDVAAFCASVYMRGLVWEYWPTTLLGMVDSCIGGKSSINAGAYKNLVGTFHPPETIRIDPRLAASLSIEQRVAGLCEAVKICFAGGDEPFAAYLARNPEVAMGEVELEGVIHSTLLTKKWFIEVDEFDRAERLLLNFGHTFGHAIEAASAFAISHGVAVGLGMLCAAELGARRGFDYAKVARVRQLVAHTEALLAKVAGLAQALGRVDPAAATERLLADKKHGADFLAVIAIDANGHLERLKLPRTPESLDTIRGVFAAIIARYGA